MLMELGVGLAMAASAVTDAVFEGIISSLETAGDVLEFGPANALKIGLSDFPEGERAELNGQRMIREINKPDGGEKSFDYPSNCKSGSLLKGIIKALEEAKEQDDSRPEEFYQQLAQLAEGLHEYLSEFLEETAEQYEAEEILSDQDEPLEPIASDYGSGEYDYERLSQAKVACKEALVRAINEMRKSYEEGKAQAAKQCEEFLLRMEKDIREFVKGYQASFDDYVSLYCEGEAKAYVMERREELTGAEKMARWYPAEDKKERLAAILKEEFEEKAQKLWDVKTYFSECDYDEDDDLYCYEMGEALSELYDASREIFEAACEKTKERMQELYTAVFDEMANDISDGLVALVKAAETEKEE